MLASRNTRRKRPGERRRLPSVGICAFFVIYQRLESMTLALNEDQTFSAKITQPIWHDNAPRELVEAGSIAASVAAWKKWQRHLRKRRKPPDLKFLKGKTPPIL